MQPLKNTLTQKDQILTLCPGGDLTSTTAASVRATVQFLFELPEGQPVPWKVLQLDLNAAQKVDSVGLNLIVNIFKAVQKAGGKMQIICTNQNVHRTLLFTRLDKFAEVVKL
jgi:anti-anti-sigma factor